MDRSVTFWHNNIKGKESWSNLIYLISRNLFSKWVWCGGMSPHSCACCCDWWCTYYGDVVVNGSCVCFLPPVRYSSWFYIIIHYILISILSWPMIPTQYVFLVLTPTCIFLLYSFVECSKCTTDFDSPSALISLQHIRVQDEQLFLARAGFSHSRLDVIEFRTWTIFLLVLVFLNTLRLGNLRIDVLDVMTSRFWG